jgi:hypothetical protein
VRVDDGRRVHRDSLVAPRSAAAAGDEGEEEEEGPRKGRWVSAEATTGDGAVVKQWGGGVVKCGGTGGGVEGEEPCEEAPTAESRGRMDGAAPLRVEVGKTRHGQRGATVAAAWAGGLPNDETNQPRAKNDVGVKLGVKGGSRWDSGLPKGL